MLQKTGQAFYAVCATVAAGMLVVFGATFIRNLLRLIKATSEAEAATGRNGLIISVLAGLFFASVIYFIGWLLRWALTGTTSTVFSYLKRR